PRFSLDRRTVGLGLRVRALRGAEGGMSEPIRAFPLHWPAGWRRTPAHQRTRAKFNAKERRSYSWDPNRSYTVQKELTVAAALERVLAVLERMGLDRDDIVISTNLELRRDGLPRSTQREPADP